MTDELSQPDRDLALRAQTGDQKAFEQLIRRHKTPLYRFVRRYIGNDEDAYDLVQDTFISVWMALQRYDKDKVFLTWLKAIALNKCRDFGRRQAVRRHFLHFLALHTAEFPMSEPEIDLDQDRLETRRLQRLNKAIAQLPFFYKAPFLLMTVDGLSQRETAQQLKTTTKAIEMRVYRARKKLLEALSDLHGEG